MIEFALSKLNLLIFVTAVAAIVIFFMGAVNSNMKMRQSYELIYKIGKEMKVGIESNSYCTVKFIELPRKIYTNSGNSDVFSLPYKLNVSAYDVTGTTVGDDSKKIVLAVIDRKAYKPKIYSAYDIDYNGNVYFYESINCSQTGCDFNLTQNSANYDPQKAYTIDNSILFVKKVENGKSNLFLIPCKKSNNLFSCKNFLQQGSNNLSERLICLEIIPDLFREQNPQ